MEQRLQVTLRPATAQDTTDVLELTRTIFDGHDYVPQVWAEWLADPAGYLLAAEHNGRVIGIGRVRQITTQDWWLEGLRVQPEFQGRGVGARLHEALVEYWRINGLGALRLATSSRRLAVHHLCKRTGFKWMGEYTYWQSERLVDHPAAFQPVDPGEAQAAMQFAMDSPLYPLQNGLIDLGWEWLPLRLEKVAAVITQSGGLWHGNRQGLLFYTMDTEDEDERPIPVVSLAAGAVEALPGLLLDFRRLAGGLGHTHCAWTAPVKVGISAALESAGYQRLWDDGVYIFENAGRSPAAGEGVV